ncbi:MAG: serine/threonine-protein phosphatase [Reyranella sp.]|uniref:PP2C family protein-serine/threonine phosphatase n=1 Tax=Reyranella sp. TaxID=1929291 RepID=UPI001AC88476|nr:protein phosphatase 2C domain-containing protein [Reyranella sp.]MBN9087109.1 serine/threonine-protein phosphatase [Reyranella sp.]
MAWRGEGAQHRGARPYQEDSWALRTLADGALLAVLADGMGGHAGGATASRLAVGAFLKAMESGRSLRDALDAANGAVGAAARRDAALDNMGTTLVAAVVQGDEVRWISVGDSPFYLATHGQLERLNADHSMVPQIEALAERGIITPEEAAHHPGRHTLREAVMGNPLTLIDEGRRGLGPGDRLLVCSDGIETLESAEIARQAPKPVQALIDAVLAVGVLGQDNVTVIRLEQEV